jgi:hypothetical protein
MGLLSLIPAALSIGSSILGSNSAKSTAKAQDRAYQEAAAKSLAAQQENFNRIFQMNDRYVQGGYLGQDALLERLGLVQPGQAGVATGATGGQSAGQSYFLQYPDVAQEFARLQGTPEGQAQLQAIGATTPDAFANFHFSTFGQNEGRTAPAAVAATPAAETPATPAAPEPGTELLTAQRPAAPAAPTFTRPADMSAPAAFKYSTKDIENDPGYIFARDEGLAGVNASFAARGKVRSGDAAKALLSRAAGVAHQWDSDYFNRALQTYNVNNDNYRFGQTRADNIFADDRAYGTSMWDTQLRRSDTNFNVDRDYQTNRYDTETNNLFRLTDSGRAAAGAVAGAGTNFANAQSNIFGQQADSTAARAAATGAANQQLYGALAAGAGNLFASWGGGARSTPTSSLGAVNYGSVSNPFGNYGQVRF